MTPLAIRDYYRTISGSSSVWRSPYSMFLGVHDLLGVRILLCSLIFTLKLARSMSGVPHTEAKTKAIQISGTTPCQFDVIFLFQGRFSLDRLSKIIPITQLASVQRIIICTHPAKKRALLRLRSNQILISRVFFQNHNVGLQYAANSRHNGDSEPDFLHAGSWC
jgi:hypothetical protein